MSSTNSLFVAQRPSTYSQGNMGNFGETRRGVGKSGVPGHKSDNISETRKDRLKVTIEGLWELTNALSNGTILDPLRPPLPQHWGFATPPKTAIAIISGRGKATECKFGRYIQKVHPNKSPWKILEKRERGRIQGLSIFFEYPLLSQEWVKLRTSNFVRIFIGSIETKAH